MTILGILILEYIQLNAPLIFHLENYKQNVAASSDNLCGKKQQAMLNMLC